MQEYNNLKEVEKYLSQFPDNCKGKLYINYVGGMYTEAGGDLFHGVKKSNVINILERHKNRVIRQWEFRPIKTNRQVRLKDFYTPIKK